MESIAEYVFTTCKNRLVEVVETLRVERPGWTRLSLNITVALVFVELLALGSCKMSFERGFYQVRIYRQWSIHALRKASASQLERCAVHELCSLHRRCESAGANVRVSL